MNVQQTKKSKKDKKRKKDKNSKIEQGEEPTKRVRFDLSMNKVTEFFKYGKVATRQV
jgi:hypothetical protein